MPTAAARSEEPEEYDGGDADDGMEEEDFYCAPSEESEGFRPDESYRPDAEHEEAADEDQDYLHPFSVIQNDQTEEEKPEDSEDNPRE